MIQSECVRVVLGAHSPIASSTNLMARTVQQCIIDTSAALGSCDSPDTEHTYLDYYFTLAVTTCYFWHFCTFSPTAIKTNANTEWSWPRIPPGSVEPTSPHPVSFASCTQRLATFACHNLFSVMIVVSGNFVFCRLITILLQARVCVSGCCHKIEFAMHM